MPFKYKETVRSCVKRILVASALFCLFTSNTSVIAQEEATVSLLAPPEMATAIDLNVIVDATGLTDFNAGQFDISFDESVIRLDSVTAGLIDSNEIPVAIWNEIDAGTVRVILNVPGILGVTGSGYLAVLHFHTIGPAGSICHISLSNGLLGDNLARQIPTIWINASLEITLFQPDINGDGLVNVLDMINVSQHMDITGLGGWIPEDINMDGLVDILDLILVGQYWTG